MHYVYDDYLFFVLSKINYFLLEAALETINVERQGTDRNMAEID